MWCNALNIRQLPPPPFGACDRSFNNLENLVDNDDEAFQYSHCQKGKCSISYHDCGVWFSAKMVIRYLKGKKKVSVLRV